MELKIEGIMHVNSQSTCGNRPTKKYDWIS